MSTMVFNRPAKSLEENVEIIGLNFIPDSEIYTALSSLDFQGKEFYKINAMDIKKLLIKRPLIKDIKVRAELIPQIKYKVYVKEDRPWAIYAKQILNDKCEVVVDSKAQAMLFESPSINDLYEDYEKGGHLLVKIVSSKLLGDDDVEILKTISDKISANLALIQAEDKVDSIVIDHEANLTINTLKYQFRFGVLDDDVLERASRVDFVVSKIKELADQNLLSYIDLSLNTGEVIIGKNDETKT